MGASIQPVISPSDRRSGLALAMSGVSRNVVCPQCRDVVVKTASGFTSIERPLCAGWLRTPLVMHLHQGQPADLSSHLGPLTVACEGSRPLPLGVLVCPDLSDTLEDFSVQAYDSVWGIDADTAPLHLQVCPHCSHCFDGSVRGSVTTDMTPTGGLRVKCC